MWQPIETAPYGKWIIGWLFLPKNPQASMAMPVQRVHEDSPDADELAIGEGPAAWWSANGMYYAKEYVTHWMPLPEPPECG